MDNTASAYVSEAKIYPRGVNGRLQRFRHAAVLWLLGMFYLVPWLRWDGRQAVLFDLPARKFHVFGLTFWPQDFPFLALLLVIAALALFFFTALAGRLWCGYACPQTVWTEVFLLMERWTEGRRLERMRLDAAPWSLHKLMRKGSKHLLWAVFALWTGLTFVGLFTPIDDLTARLATIRWGRWEMFWVLFYGLATWGNAGFLREQVCKYMCPYARFQSAMFDRNTLVITYDNQRGEPRGPQRRHAEGQQAGDCVDCTICVQVCPTGIDIRNGLQYECIGCGACIDGCNEVMDKIGRPHGLVRYSTQNAIDGKRTRILRPRIVIYGALLLVLCGAWLWGVTHRSPFLVEVLRDRNALYRIAGDGTVENTYTVKIVNKTDQPAVFHLELIEQPDGATLRGVPEQITAPASEVIAVPMMVAAPDGTAGRHTLRMVIRAEGSDAVKEVASSFFAPAASP
jgi:cytochrome c oxidase accessory protein FixG